MFRTTANVTGWLSAGPFFYSTSLKITSDLPSIYILRRIRLHSLRSPKKRGHVASMPARPETGPAAHDLDQTPGSLGDAVAPESHHRSAVKTELRFSIRDPTLSSSNRDTRHDGHADILQNESLDVPLKAPRIMSTTWQLESHSDGTTKKQLLPWSCKGDGRQSAHRGECSKATPPMFRKPMLRRRNQRHQIGMYIGRLQFLDASRPPSRNRPGPRDLAPCEEFLQAAPA